MKPQNFVGLLADYQTFRPSTLKPNTLILMRHYELTEFTASYVGLLADNKPDWSLSAHVWQLCLHLKYMK